MILHRVVELQAATITCELTDTQAEYEFIESLIEGTKPPIERQEWHHLIATPFRYPVPVLPRYAARFKPPYSRVRAFYGAGTMTTALYEFAYHWLRERVHLPFLSHAIEKRTHFTVSFNRRGAICLRDNPAVDAIMDRTDYSASHRFYEANHNAPAFVYPSARDPEHADCACVFSKQRLGKKPIQSTMLHVRFIHATKSAEIDDPSGVHAGSSVAWDEVA